MSPRKDASPAAAKMGREIYRIAERSAAGVCTIGACTTQPGIVTSGVEECRLMLHPRRLGPAALARMAAEARDASARFAREGEVAVGRSGAAELVSATVVPGTVQVPPDGQPIVLLAERQTIGGYPQIGHVISVDLPKLARAWPGTWVKFREVAWDEAQELKRREERDFAWLRTGLELLKSKP